MTAPASAPEGQAALLAIARRSLGVAAPGALVRGAGGAPMEVARDDGDAARLSPARVIEGDTVRAHPVAGVPEAPFAAFLDGIQRTERVGYLDAAPILLGTVAAVVRERREGRLRTWAGGFARETRLYLPLARVPDKVAAHLSAAGFALADTLDAGRLTKRGMPTGGDEDHHPLELERRAFNAIREHRGAMERRLADAWVERGAGSLFVDGPLPGDLASRSRAVVGVVKSHRVLQVTGEALRLVLALRAGERSSVLERTSATRVSVATWYLRLRDPAVRREVLARLRLLGTPRALEYLERAGKK